MDLLSGHIPTSYDYKNVYNSRFRPGTVHCKDTMLVWYFQRYLIQKIIYVFDFDGIPENWDADYFRYCLFVLGHCEVIKTRTFGIIPQAGVLGGYNVFYRPKFSMIANPLLKGSIKADLGIDTESVRMQPDYGGAWDIVSYYADLMALCSEAIGVNLLNSKLAYVFASGNKAEAESFKKLFDNIASGQPAQFADKQLFTEDGNPRWMMFNQNLKQTYISNDIFNTLLNINSEFNTLVGIPNVNISKASGVSESEVQANNTQTRTLAEGWLEEIRNSLERVNNMFGLDLSVRMRFEDQTNQEGGADDGDSVDSGSVQMG